MDEMYGLQSTVEYADKALMSPENLMILPSEYQSLLSSSAAFRDRLPMFGSDELLSAASVMSEAASGALEFQREEEASSIIKAKIASHPSYPKLLEAYIDCQKVNIYFFVCFVFAGGNELRPKMMKFFTVCSLSVSFPSVDF